MLLIYQFLKKPQGSILIFILTFTMLNYIKTKLYEKNIIDSFKHVIVS